MTRTVELAASKKRRQKQPKKEETPHLHVSMLAGGEMRLATQNRSEFQCGKGSGLAPEGSLLAHLNLVNGHGSATGMNCRAVIKSRGNLDTTVGSCLRAAKHNLLVCSAKIDFLDFVFVVVAYSGGSVFP